MTQQTHGRFRDYALLLAVCGVVFFLNLGSATLWDADEGRNATAAYEMLESGNWIVPTFNGKLRDHKPVLLYWLQALAYATFGINEFAARLPSALAALATVGIGYEFARAMFGRATGLLAAFAFATSPMICGASRFANPDALLNLFGVAYLAGFWFTLRRPSLLGFALMGVAAGFGVLAKGPVGLILPAAVVVLFLAWERRWRFLFQGGWLLSIVTFCVTGLPWYIWVAIETRGEFIRQFIFKHNFSRGLSAMEEHRGFFGYYAIVLILGTLPWSIFLPVSIWVGLHSAVRKPWIRWRSSWDAAHDIDGETRCENGVDTTSSYRLLLVWMAVYLTFFSIAATKLPNYVLPTSLPAAILIGRFLHRWRVGELKIPMNLPITGAATMMLMGAVIFLALMLVSGVWFGPVLTDLEPMQLQWWSCLGLVIIASACFCWWCARTGQFRRFVLAIGVAAFATAGTIGAFGLPLVNHVKAPKPLLEDLGLLSQEEDIRLGVWDLEYLPSLNFYSLRNVEELLDQNEVTEFLRSKLPSYVFMSEDHWRQIEPTLRGSARAIGRRQDLLKRKALVVVTNR